MNCGSSNVAIRLKGFKVHMGRRPVWEATKRQLPHELLVGITNWALHPIPDSSHWPDPP